MADVGYVSVEYADQYVSTHYLSTDDLRKTWEGLSPEDKAALLQQSFDAMELLPYTGRKTNLNQSMAFPRCPDAEVPDAVKHAQIENALSLKDPSATDDSAFYGRLWQFGVESYSIGNLSEKISSGAWSKGSPVQYGVVSAKSTRLLQPYLSGSYNISRGRRR